ncbi:MULTISPECIES: ABC transporter substrate-binding protein [unclassified Pseudovibrio]|uniref:ABC transporter substrate-binding protein n=1 Tax=unclassified Pseudovibrio TaxID=2627060 RepID=UPI0007AE7654|nr:MULTISPECIES: ABC transporter substrate-binding protein [unclassified Pseudovibrio]KZL02666.1 Oligopeptide-binding protein AppA precursor [Pseudovibrio sp. W74]KZL12335.1 Oligopeptide-binding protein AppA precursor [Pseudovibrio sp. Ad14]
MTLSQISRRSFLHFSAATAAAFLVPGGALPVQAGTLSHGLSVFGDLKYPKDFTAFDYVNPEAPVGGKIAMTAPSWGYNQNPQTFNTFNTFILKGDAPPRMELCFDSLMVRAYDEPDAVYGLVAESALVSEDGNFVTFKIRPEARFHDGSMLNAEDVAFSLNLLKEKGHPIISQSIKEMVSATAPDEHTVTVAFSGNHSRQLPLLIATLPIVSKAYYTRYNFEASTLTPPLSSGPYMVGRYEIGRYIEYKKVENYWAKDLPVNNGHHNFEIIRLDFFRDRQATFEAFKKGRLTFHEEFSSKTWATEYNFPALTEGRVAKKEFAIRLPSGAQGWFLNSRKEKFSNPKVREALGYAFDFEWSNSALFYDLYTRTQSFFENSEMKAVGLPSDAELALLEPYKKDLPEGVFGEAITQPVSNGSGQDRKLLREASLLLKEAGYYRRGEQLIGPDGKQLQMEFLSNSPAFERIVLPYVKNLRLLGIEASFRVVDPAQFQKRVDDFDYDIVGHRFSLTPTLGPSIRNFWTSASAETFGSYNLSGIKVPAVDDLVDKALNASSREEMITAARALDRVLRAGYYWVPQWFKAFHTVAVWDMFGIPNDMPAYAFPVEATWWVDSEKAARIGKEN